MPIFLYPFKYICIFRDPFLSLYWKATTDTTEIQRIVSDYYEQLYSNKFDILVEMDKFIETYTLPRQNHEEI